MSPIRIVAAVFMLAAMVALFATDNPRVFAVPLIIGNVLVLWDNWRERRADP